jgi:hypothetical protein
VATTDRLRTITPGGLLATGAYVALGALLCWSRLVGLGRSYASDELMTVRDFVRAGPREILTGSYIPNNHELFSLLGWATTQLVGESEIALRLWSVIPFLAGVALVTAWLHVRMGALSGILFLFFCTASPLLLDITRQARGYGLAFLAMAVLIVSALEAERTKRGSLIALFCAAGVVGTWTLPHFGIAFLATALVLIAMPELRRATTLALGPAVLAIAVWYAPNLGDILRSSQQEYAAPIRPAWVVTAPIDQVLIPALRWLDEVLLDPGVASLALVAALLLVVAASPLIRHRPAAFVLGAGVVATIAVAAITRVNVAPRFFSFLLVPLLILLASGAGAVVARFAARGRPVVPTGVVALTIALVAVAFVETMADVARYPREAVREAAVLIGTATGPSTHVVAYLPYPQDLEHHLGRDVEVAHTPAEAQAACSERREQVVVTQPWILQPVELACTGRAGTRHFRLDQYARGGHIDVWLVPGER